MTWKELLALPFVVVALAFLVAVGALAWKVGDTWEPRNTDILITGLVTACAGGMVVIGVVVGLVVGLPFMVRMLRETSGSYAPMERWPQTIDGRFRQLPHDALPLLPMQENAYPPTQPTQPYPPTMGVSLDAIDNDDAFGEW